MFMSAMLPQISQQIMTGLISMAIDEKIDNPYLKAILQPMAGVFVAGIMNGTGFNTMGQQMVGQTQPGTYDPATGEPLSKTIPQKYKDKAQTYGQAFEQMAIQYQNKGAGESIASVQRAQAQTSGETFELLDGDTQRKER